MNLSKPQEKELTQIETKSSKLVQEAEAFEVSDAESYAQALDRAKSIITKVKDIVKNFFDPIEKPLKEAVKAARERRKPIEDAGEDAKRIYQGKAWKWKEKENTRIREENEKREKDAREKAAADARKAGDKKEAKAIERGEQPVAFAEAAPAAVVSTVDPIPDIWTAEVEDKLAHLDWVVKQAKKRPELLTSIEIKMGDWTKQAARQKETFSVPGLKAVKNARFNR